MPASNIILLDGFDTYGTVDNIVDTYSALGLISMAIVAGRYAGNGLKFNGNSSITYFFPDNQYLCVSFALHVNAATAVRAFCSLFDAADGHIDLRLNTNGTIAWTRAGTTLATSTSAIQFDCWNYFEWKIMISNSITASSCQLRLNGELVIDLAAATDTQNGLNSFCNKIKFSGEAVAQTTPIFDDLILQVGTGSDFLNNNTIISTLPTGNGNSSNFTGSDSNSTDNYLLVDDSTPDDDSTYVESGTIGHKDLYTFPSLGITANSVTALGVSINCKRSDSGLRTLCSVVRSSSSEQDGPTVYLSDSYFYQIQSIFPTNPATSSAWTQGEAEAAQVGQKVVS